MQRTPKRLVEGNLLTVGAATYYTAPANTKADISAMTATNTTGTARTITIYLVPSGGAAGAASTLVSVMVIPANKTMVINAAIGQKLEPGDFIQALADAGSAVTLIASGYEVIV